MKNIKVDESVIETLKKIESDLMMSTDLSMETLKVENTVLITLDVINGFLKKGNLSSDRVLKVLPNIVELHNKFNNYPKVFFKDSHTEDAVEFTVYPEHCKENEWESELVEELDPFINKDVWIINKNSTNGFLTHNFMEWLSNNLSVHQFVIIGDCTDICIKQFALTLKSYFNENNELSRVIVPMDSVDTFDLDVTNHNGNLMNLMSFYEMKANGIEIVRSIK